MDGGELPGISAYASAYAGKLKWVLIRQAERRREQVFLAGVWIPGISLAETTSKLRKRKRAMLLLVHLGAALLVLAMLIFWYLFAWMFLP